MAKANAALQSFNRGECSRLALGRTDVDHMRLAAETQLNWQPTTLGPMTLRPGMQYLGTTDSLNDSAIFIPFVFSNDDVASIELTDNKMRVWVPSTDADTANVYAANGGNKEDIVAAAEDGELEVIERPSVPTSDPNSQLAFNATNWKTKPTTDGCFAEFVSSELRMRCPPRGGIAGAFGTFVVYGAPNQLREHAFRIVIRKGPVTFFAGSAEGRDNIIERVSLAEGTHSIAFTPSSSVSQANKKIWVQFETSSQSRKIVQSIDIEGSGAFSIPTDWNVTDLPFIRWAQSGDVIFVACRGSHPMRIERHSARGWSLVKYLPGNGPLMAVASEEDIRLTPGATHGNTTLRANRPFFKSTHEGALFRLFTDGQLRRCILGAQDATSDPARVTGVGASQRFIRIKVSGNASARIWTQRSFEDGDLGIGFTNIENKLVSGAFSEEFTYEKNKEGDDNDDDPVEMFDNSITFYRVKITQYSRGTINVEYGGGGNNRDEPLSSGGGAGICRITSVTSSREAEIEILEDFSSILSTDNWQEGEWSTLRGFPDAVAFHDGRLWWFRGDRIWGSVSDDFANFDIEKEGDAAPISRSIGYGPIDTINWALPLTRLIVGREGAEASIRSGSLDEPITPTAFTLKDCSTKGSARIAAVKADTRGIFVAKGQRRLYELSLDSAAGDYSARDLTRFHPEIGGEDGFRRLCIRSQPETEVHCVRNDGQVAILLYNVADEVIAWWRLETDGTIEDAFTLPGEFEDNVYYLVRRVINGNVRRHLEKVARLDQCSGRPEARLADAHIIDTGGNKTITGLSHLNGELVSAWGWNNNQDSGVHIMNPARTDGRWLVAGGKIVVSQAFDNICVGLTYTADFKSAKLAYAASQGTAVNQKKRLDHLGLILFDTHYQGLEYGQSEDAMDALPLVSEGATIAANTVHDEFDEPMIEVPGEWDSDSRLFLRAESPRPCTVAAAVIGIETIG